MGVLVVFCCVFLCVFSLLFGVAFFLTGFDILFVRGRANKEYKGSLHAPHLDGAVRGVVVNVEDCNLEKRRRREGIEKEEKREKREQREQRREKKERRESRSRRK